MADMGRSTGWAGDPHQPARPPRYVDEVFEDFVDAPLGQFHHLGHWSDLEKIGEVSRPEAQTAMNDLIVELAGVRDSDSVLDVGSGFGGTLASINSRFHNVNLVGVDVDHRQVNLSSGIPSGPGNTLLWSTADACRLPFRASVFDRLLSIEAMWHFPSRSVFLSEASRVLRQGGRIALVDIFVEANSASEVGMTQQELHRTLLDGFGPWPELEASASDVLAAAEVAGFTCTDCIDATENTKPTYFDSPDTVRRRRSDELSSTRAVQLFVELHQRGLIKVVYFGMVKL